jgi:MFS transporter, SP family, sugar:H+ symporter
LTVTLGTLTNIFANATLDAAGNPTLVGSAGTIALIAANLYVFCFGFSTTFPPLLKYFGLGTTYGLYTFVAAISIFFVAFFIKETKGLELEQM